MHFILFILASLAFFSCNQDPIFYTISQEVKPLPPRIEGTPTNMVCIDDTMYVASNSGTKIHRYTSPQWEDTIDGPSDKKIVGLATTNSNLYVLAMKSDDVTLEPLTLWKQAPVGNTWTPITIPADYKDIQSIYGTEDVLFIGSKTGKGTDTNNFAILRYDGTNVTELCPGTGLLKGAVKSGSYYYLATAGNGIWVYDSHLQSVGTGEASSANIQGIIKLATGTIIAISKDGYLYSTSAGGTTFTASSRLDTSLSFTGAVALWTDDTNNLLLLGVRNISYNGVHGYREIMLDGDGELIDPTTIQLQTPGKYQPSTVDSYDRYASSIGLYPALALFQFQAQAPGTEKTLFAATVKKGLWSYRTRSGIDQWNAED
jgi:hypothetical protein